MVTGHGLLKANTEGWVLGAVGEAVRGRGVLCKHPGFPRVIDLVPGVISSEAFRTGRPVHAG